MVTDNGVGFDPQGQKGNSRKHRAGSGNGLRNIRSRLAQIGGQSEIHSAAGKGTRVEFFVPLLDFTGGPPAAP